MSLEGKRSEPGLNICNLFSGNSPRSNNSGAGNCLGTAKTCASAEMQGSQVVETKEEE